MHKNYRLTHLKSLEAEAIFIMREVAAQFEQPVLLFSGGKDSIVMVRLAQKAFHPARLPFPLMHIDTGHNFPETIEFRDRLVEEVRADLIVRTVQDSIDRGRATEEKGPNASRNALQIVTLLDALEEFQFSAAIGGARRDVPRARRAVDEDRLRRFVIERVMCAYGFSACELRARFGEAAEHVMAEARAYARHNPEICRFDAFGFRLENAAFPFARSVAATFDTYLEGGRGRHSSAV